MKNSIAHWFHQYLGSPLAEGLRWLALVFVLFQAVVAVTATSGTTTCQVGFGSAVAYVTGAPSSGYCTNTVININGGGASVQFTTATPSTAITDWNALAVCDPLGAPPQAGSLTLTPCAQGVVPLDTTTTTAAPTTSTVASTTTTTTMPTGTATCQLTYGSAIAYVTGAPSGASCSSTFLNLDGGGASVVVTTAPLLVDKTQRGWGNLASCDPLGAPPGPGSVTFTPCYQGTPPITTMVSQVINFGSVPTLVVGGTGTVSATGGASGNAVTFTSTTPLVCAVSGNIVSGVSVGSCVLKADQAGNSNYLAAPQATQTIAVSAGLQSISLDAAPVVVVGGAGTLSAAGGASNNPVIFTSTTSGVCTVSGNIVTGVSVGSCVLKADQVGNSNYLAAPQASLTITVARGSQVITFGQIPILTVASTGTLSASGGASGTPVVFTSNTPSVCSVVNTTVAGLTAGSCEVVANQEGNANYNAAPAATQTIAVAKGSQSIVFGAAPSLLLNGTGNLTATGGASGSPVVFTSKSATICTVSGSTVSALITGDCVVVANQAGNANYNAAAQVTQTITIVNSIELLKGWNLLGNSTTQPVAVGSVFSDTSLITSVWKWDPVGRVWYFYSPKLSPAELEAYTLAKSYRVLSVIDPGDGFWVDALVSAMLPGFSGAPFSLGKDKLVVGWNLVATADSITPSVFNMDLSVSPPSPGSIPINLTSLWLWDTPKRQWFFYSPKLEDLGGTALTDYTTAKNYLDFKTENRKLGQGTGFWVDKP